MNITDLQNINLSEKVLDLLTSKPENHEEIKRIQWLREKLGLPRK